MPRQAPPPCDLILALDLPSREAALPLLDQLQGELRWIKVGLQLFTRYGPALVEDIAARGFHVFLDLKLHDIPNTVGSAVASLATLPIGMLTLHATGGPAMMRHAREVQLRENLGLQLLAVTVLTSMDRADLAATGFDETPASLVERLARLAAEAGIDGLVCSPLELEDIRHALGPGLTVVTPGVRPAGQAAHDQARVLTPAQAAARGASYIVMGRPILEAPQPANVVRAVLEDIRTATTG